MVTVEPRDHAKYQFIDRRGRIMRSGITKRGLATREAELRRETGVTDGTIRQVGRRTTKSAALAWERRQHKGTPPGGR